MCETISEIKQSFQQLAKYLPEVDQFGDPQCMKDFSSYCDRIIKLVIESMISYEKCLQQLQSSLRKHIKNEIQLKIYYEHLQSVIADLKLEKNQNCSIIDQMKTEISNLRQKQKYYLTLTNLNTKQNSQQMNKLQSKIDTIARIKNRLSLNNTQDFFTDKYGQKIDKGLNGAASNRGVKRQSLVESLRNFYEKPNKQKSMKPSKQKSEKQNKQKSGQKSKNKNKRRSQKKNEHSKSKQSKQSNDLGKRCSSRKSVCRKQETDHIPEHNNKNKNSLNKSAFSSRKVSCHRL